MSTTSESKAKPTVKSTFEHLMDRVLGVSDSNNAMITSHKNGFKLRGEDADLYMVKCRSQTRKTTRKE